MTAFTHDQWIILALVFVLGLLVGMFMTAGGRKKWKTRYYDERKRLEDRERDVRGAREALGRPGEGMARAGLASRGGDQGS